MIKTSPYLLAAAIGAQFLLPPSPALARSESDGSGELAALIGDWRVGPVVTKDGAFAYCIAEGRFDNGQSLVIARSRQGELNIGIAMSAAHLTRGASWPVTLVLGGDFKRQRQAVAADPNMLVVANGADEPLFQALSRDGSLKINGPHDAIGYQLSGTGKAMAGLKDCSERADSQPAAPLGSVASTPLQLPPALKRLLAEAGFKTIGLMPAAAVPQGLGPADFVWKTDTVVAGMAEFRTEPGQGLSNLSGNALNQLREQRCSQGFSVTEGESANLPRGSFRSVTVACTSSAGIERHIAFLFEFGRTGLYKHFFFEAADPGAAIHDREAIARVLKQAESH